MSAESPPGGRTVEPVCRRCHQRHRPGEPHAPASAFYDELSRQTAEGAAITPHRVVNGRYFEEFRVGDAFTTVARTLVESDVSTFASLTGDYNPIHVDEEFAAGSRWGGRIVHGLCVLSISSGLFSRLGLIDGTAEAFLSVDTQFHDVVRIGDTIHVETRVVRKRSLPGQASGVVNFEALTYNQHGRLVQRGSWSATILCEPTEDRPEG